jgi:RimJ/RimL family protein N-acetyltransferase
MTEVTLKKLRSADLPLLLELKAESWRTTHHTSILNEEDQNRWFDSLDTHPTSPRNLVMVGCLKDQRIGIFKLSPIDWQNRSAEVGWDLFAPFRGKGLGKPLVLAGTMFAFRELSLHRISCEILSNNDASIKCALAAGFSYEGKKREAVLRFGNYLDSLIYGQLSYERDELWNKN